MTMYGEFYLIDRVGEPTAETNKRLAANQKNSGDPLEQGKRAKIQKREKNYNQLTFLRKFIKFKIKIQAYLHTVAEKNYQFAYILLKRATKLSLSSS